MSVVDAAHADLFDRSVWDLDRDVLHLNHGSFGAVMHPVRLEQERWRDVVEANPDGFYTRHLATALDTVRERVARFVHADPAGVLLQPNVTWAIESVLASVPLGAGDEVLITDDTYAAVRRAAQSACDRSGATLVQAALPAADAHRGDLIASAVEQNLSARTRLAIIDHITSPTAVALDVTPLVRRVHAQGGLVLIDGAHVPGMFALDVDGIGADFYAGNFHKWCCAPRGSAFLAVAAAWRDRLRPLVHGAVMDRGFPGGLEWWGTTDYTALLATPSALDLLDAHGIDSLRRRNAQLVNDGAAMVCAALRQAPPPPSSIAMIAVALPSHIAPDAAAAARLRARIATDIAAEVMITSARGGAVLRLSAHAYNRREDFATLSAYLGSLA